jgi:hypothetical protein
MMLIIALAVLALITVVTVTTIAFQRERISPQDRGQLLRQWKHVETVSDPGRRVLEAEKVVDGLLTALHCTGSFGDKLKAAGPLLGDVESLWKAHKVRNRLAHEAGFSVSDEESRRAVAAFERTLMRFLR